MLHDNDWHLHVVTRDRRASQLTKAVPLIESGRIKRGLDDNRIANTVPRLDKRVQKKTSAHTATSFCWIDVDRDHGSRCRFTEANDPAIQLGDKDGAAADWWKVTIWRPVEQPTVNNFGRIVSCAKGANRRYMKVVQPRGIFWRCRPNYDGCIDHGSDGSAA